MRQVLASLAAIGMFCSAAAAETAAEQKVDALGWMAGTWLMQKGESWTEERWGSPRGGG